jgi:O-antigen ligase
MFQMLSKTTTATAPLTRFNTAEVLTVAATMAAAVLVGFNVGQERWFIVAIFVALPILLLWPVQVALGCFAFLIPFDEIASVGNSDSSGRALTFYIGAAAGLTLLGVALVGRRIKFPPRSALWWTVVVLWGSATALWAVEPSLSLHRVPTEVSLLLLYLAAVSLRIKETEFSSIAIAAILGGLVFSLFAVSQFYGGVSYVGTLRGSLTVAGKQEDPDQLAATLLLPISLGLGVFLYSGSRIKRALSLGAVAVMGLALLLTMSRGALVALSVMCLLYLYRLRLRWRRILFSVVILVLLLPLMPNGFFVAIYKPDRGSGRLDIWQVGIAMLQRKPLLGIGLDNFPFVYRQFAGMAPVFRGYTSGPHNIYLGRLLETGAIGFLLFLGALISQFRSARSAHARSNGNMQWLVACEAACFGTLAAGFFLDIFWRKSFWLAWILLTLACQPPQAHELGKPS